MSPLPSKRTAAIPRPPILKVLAWEQGTWALLALAIGYFDQAIALSILAGSVICCLPSAYVALQAFRFTGARAAELAMRAFYRGELGKFVLAAVLFLVALHWVPPLRLEYLAITYIAATVLHGWATARCVTRR